MFDSFLCQAVFRLETGQISYKQQKKNLKWTFGKATETKSEKEPRLNDSLTYKKNVLAPNTTSGLALAVLKTT